ncbi:hypothetical protein Cni_G08449 [Canna indica]|uniref:Uncharacterized protein n=1 Tax=Canna indica TaxID=4628 RepID=A0AAQ3K2X8_9LILI|nr:hypothetical protein Cni_G08449 [Canna indica]
MPAILHCLASKGLKSTSGTCICLQSCIAWLVKIFGIWLMSIGCGVEAFAPRELRKDACECAVGPKVFKRISYVGISNAAWNIRKNAFQGNAKVWELVHEGL